MYIRISLYLIKVKLNYFYLVENCLVINHVTKIMASDEIIDADVCIQEYVFIPSNRTNFAKNIHILALV